MIEMHIATFIFIIIFMATFAVLVVGNLMIESDKRTQKSSQSIANKLRAREI